MITDVLKRLTVMYGPPKTDNAAAFFDEYKRAMHGASDEVLERAADTLLRTNQYKSWPTIAECLKAVGRAQRDLQASKQQPIGKHRGKPQLDKHVVDGLLRDNYEMTGRACAEGWVVGLHDFVRDHHRLPKPDERADLRNAANYVEACATGDNDLGAMHFSLVKLAQALMVRRGSFVEEFS